MFQSLLQHTDDGATVCSVRLVYLCGLAAETDADVLRQLASLPGHPHVVTASSVRESLEELRKTVEDYQALVMSPALSESETIEAIAGVREQEAAVTILPIVYDYNQHDFVSAGASDVLVIADGLLVDPVDIVARVAPMSDSDATDGSGNGSAKKKKKGGIRSLFSRGRSHADALAEREQADRLLLKSRLDKIHQAHVQPVSTVEPVNEHELEATPTPPSGSEHSPFLELNLSDRQRTVDRAPSSSILSILSPPSDDEPATPDLSLAETRAALQKANETLVAERAAWSTIRKELDAATAAAQAEVRKAVSLHASDAEANAKEQRAAADARAKLESLLAEAQAGLQAATDALNTERANWTTARQALETAGATAQVDLEKTVTEQAAALEARATELREATDARAKLEAALAQVQTERRQAAAAIETERAGWNTVRQQLEATAQNAQADLQKAVALHADLDLRTKELQESTAARVRLETALAEVQAEQVRITATIGAERTAWNAVRQELEDAVQAARSKAKTADQTTSALEARTRELKEATDARAKLEAALAAVHADHRTTGEAVEAERATWAATRQQLEAAVTAAQAELKAAAGAHAAELGTQSKAVSDVRDSLSKAETALHAIQAERQKAAETRAAEQTAWTTTRQQLEAALVEARQKLASTEHASLDLELRTKELREAAEARAKSDAALTELQAERRRANDAFVAERAAWNAMRQHLEAAVQDARTKAQGADETNSELNLRMKELRESIEARAKLEGALADAHAGRHKADELFDAERAAWNVARAELQTTVDEAQAKVQAAAHSTADLEARTQELRKSAEARVKLEASLAEAQVERQKSEAAMAAERVVWEAARRHLEGEARDGRARLQAAEQTARDLQTRTTGLQEAVDAGAKLEARLAETQAEQKRDRDTFGTERASWHATQQQLEVALGEARTRLQAAEHATHDLEARGKDLQEAVEARAKLEARLAETQAEHTKDRDVFGVDRAAWHRTEQQLEAALADARSKLEGSEQAARELDARTTELRTQTDARSRLEAELVHATTEHHKTHETLTIERAALAVARKDLDAAIHESRARLAAAERVTTELETRTKELHASTEARSRVETELAHARAAHEKARHAFDEERTAWNGARRELDRAINDTRTQLAAAVADLKAERRTALAAIEVERATSVAVRQQVEAAAGAVQEELQKTIAIKAAELEARNQELRTSATLCAKLEASLAQSQAEQQTLHQQFEAEQTAWQSTRQSLEAVATNSQAELKKTVARHGAEHALLTKELHETAQQRSVVEAALKQAETEIKTAETRHAEAAAAWQAARTALERQVADQGASVREELRAELTSARAELAGRTETFNAERTDWQVTRRLLEARVGELQAAAEARDKFEEALMAARSELQEGIDTHAAERASWEELRRHREAGSRGGDKKKGGSAASEKDEELLDAYRALEARVRETTNRLQLVRGGSGKWLLGGEGGYDTREELAHTERLHTRRVEEVAKLAIAMTPEISELVASIEDVGNRLSRELGPAAAEQHNAQAILQRSKEAGDLLRQLAAFMEKHTQPVVALNLAAAVREAEPMLTWMVGTHIDFKTHLEETAVVNVDGDDLQRLLTALVMAARDLLTAGGSVLIETIGSAAADPDPSDPAANAEKESSGPVLTVTASGYGVRPPFLSPELDLLVRECGGRAAVSSTPNGGSSLEVVFGQARQQEADPVRRPDSPSMKLRTAG